MFSGGIEKQHQPVMGKSLKFLQVLKDSTIVLLCQIMHNFPFSNRI